MTTGPPCDRKRRFDTERAALDELARIMTRAILGDRNGVDNHGQGAGTPLETGCYECPTCRAWHLSSRPWGGNIVNARAS